MYLETNLTSENFDIENFVVEKKPRSLQLSVYCYTVYLLPSQLLTSSQCIIIY